jgi:Holliday junction resolvase
LARGHDRERRYADYLRSLGWWVAHVKTGRRTADNLCAVDLAAARLIDGCVELVFIEVKSTAGGPFETFGPQKRSAFLREAQKAGAKARLVWMPPGVGKPENARVIPAAEWPKTPAASDSFVD